MLSLAEVQGGVDDWLLSEVEMEVGRGGFIVNLKLKNNFPATSPYSNSEIVFSKDSISSFAFL